MKAINFGFMSSILHLFMWICKSLSLFYLCTPSVIFCCCMFLYLHYQKDFPVTIAFFCKINIYFWMMLLLCVRYLWSGSSTKRPLLITFLPYITVVVCVIPCIICSWTKYSLWGNGFGFHSVYNLPEHNVPVFLPWCIFEAHWERQSSNGLKFFSNRIRWRSFSMTVYQRVNLSSSVSFVPPTHICNPPRE
jgi:hypothetical protein